LDPRLDVASGLSLEYDALIGLRLISPVRWDAMGEYRFSLFEDTARHGTPLAPEPV
jgi:hypothetical protein